MRSLSTGVLCETESGNRILLVSSDTGSHASVRDYLGAHGFIVDIAMTCESALSQAQSNFYRTILLEVGGAGFDGFDALGKIREIPYVDTVMLTGPGGDLDRILALEMGADDYLSKPFHFRELLARIHALRRRKDKHSQEGRLTVDDIEMDLQARTVFWRRHLLQLTTAEFGLLEILLRSAGHAVSREALVHAVLARQFSPFDRSLDMLVSRLRKKLQAVGIANRVKTVRSLGYQFATSSSRERFYPANVAV